MLAQILPPYFLAERAAKPITRGIMSYIVLARKYRPQNFKQVYAQDHVTEILQSAISSQRIAHAYLFTGPRGVGKTSLARIMAKSLNCVQGPTPTPCNQCSNCLEITAGTSTDVIEIDGASNTGVDDIRELQRELLYAPSTSLYKIYIIDEVHMLSKNAFNALLKTLEEPPENVIFIFATTEPQKVLPTIISRCQRYDFKRIPIEAIVKQLKEICEQEKISIDSESLYLIARKADGGMRDALSLMDQSISYCLDNITIDKVRQIFGLIPNQIYYELLKLVDAKDAQGVVQQLHSIFEQGTDLQEFTSNMLEFLRVLILHKLGVKVKDVNPEELPIFEELSQYYSQNKLMYMLSMLVGCRNDLRTSSNPYLIMEAMMIKLCKMDEMDDIAEILAKLSTGSIVTPKAAAPENRPAYQPKPGMEQAQAVHPALPKEEAAPAKLEFTEENLKMAWPRILQRVKKLSQLTGVALDQLQSTEITPRGIKLSTASSTHHNSLKSNLDKLQAIMADIFVTPVHVELQLLEGDKPTKVEIRRRSIEDLKAENPDLASYIEATDSILN